MPSGSSTKKIGAARLDKGQRPVERPVGGAKAGAVAVETHHRLGPRFPDQLQLFFRKRGAERGDGLAEAGLGQCDGVHVAFADDQPAAFACPERLAGGAVAIEDGGLVEELGIAGVQVFRLGIRRQAPAPERDDGAAHIGDREHQAAAEKVERLAALVAFADQAGFDEFLSVKPCSFRWARVRRQSSGA
jgi:hypothetical protein